MRYRVLICSLFGTLLAADHAPAQLFNSIEGLKENSQLQNAGQLSGNRRFLRQNRRRDDFVGRGVDASRGFVGEAQGRAAGRVQTAVETLREEPVVPVNTPRPASPRTGIYEPRLIVGFGAAAPPKPDQQLRIQTTVSRSLASRFDSMVAVSLSDGTAILTGEVDSAEAKQLATLVVQFEPGVESVRNELTVRGLPVLPPP